MLRRNGHLTGTMARLRVSVEAGVALSHPVRARLARSP
jgi:hypothetical protein